MANNIDHQPLSLDHLLLSSVVDNINISSIMKLILASILLFGAATIPSASSIRVLRSLDKLSTIVDIAEANEDFSILVAAVKMSSVYLLFFLRTFLGRMSSGEDILFLRVPTWTLVQNRWSHSLFRHKSACAQC